MTEIEQMLAQMCSPALHALLDSSFPAASGSAEWHVWASSSCNFVISSPIYMIFTALSSYKLPLSNGMYDLLIGWVDLVCQSGNCGNWSPSCTFPRAFWPLKLGTFIEVHHPSMIQKTRPESDGNWGIYEATYSRGSTCLPRKLQVMDLYREGLIWCTCARYWYIQSLDSIGLVVVLILR